MDPIPSYRYFRDPRAPAVTTWKDEPAESGLCGRTGPGYSGPYSGEAECVFLCEPCLVAGKLGHYGLTTNAGDVAALRNQLRHLPEIVRERLVRDRSDELKHRTPRLVTWQDLTWPACCGNYTPFEGEVGREEFARLAAAGDPWSWFLEHAREPGSVGFVAEDLAPHASRPGKRWSLVVYHFRCGTCGRSILHWDRG